MGLFCPNISIMSSAARYVGIDGTGIIPELEAGQIKPQQLQVVHDAARQAVIGKDGGKS
jgi:hypothetical protein